MREIVGSSLYWHPSIGPIYLDTEEMIPKHLLFCITETYCEIEGDNGVTVITIRYFVGELDSRGEVFARISGL